MKGLIEAIEAESVKQEVPAFNVGDTVSVGYRIIEGDNVKLEMSPYDLTKGRITWRSKS